MPRGVCKQTRDFELPRTCPGWRRLLLDCHRELVEIEHGYDVGYVHEKFGLLSVLVLPGVGFTGGPRYEALYAAMYAVCQKYEHYALGVC